LICRTVVRDGDYLRAATAQEVLDRAAALIAQRFRAGAPVLGSPERTRQYLRYQIGTLPYEVFGLLTPQHASSAYPHGDPRRRSWFLLGICSHR